MTKNEKKRLFGPLQNRHALFNLLGFFCFDGLRTCPFKKSIFIPIVSWKTSKYFFSNHLSHL